ncbi:hypothetical protein DPEC_G00229450 [Dallia pectoralis]|uniref:Uncharacterized protein n=1 Tax=Dallia pectoralis TaxID=75939 RepID=A0ACC2G1S0_DALPE|nr:hypothetical protein DPEC_G00229450 [Dallia pectoralis]
MKGRAVLGGRGTAWNTTETATRIRRYDNRKLFYPTLTYFRSKNAEVCKRSIGLNFLRYLLKGFMPEATPLLWSDPPTAAKQIQAQRKGASALTFLKLTKEFFSMVKEGHFWSIELITRMFDDNELMKSVQEAAYDLFLTDPAIGAGLLLAHHLKLPVVLNVRWITSGEGHFAIAPSPLSYIPSPGSGFTDKMTFVQRVQNVLFYSVIMFQQRFLLGPSYNAFCIKYFKKECDIISLIQEADLWLMRSDFVFDFPRPTMPNVVYVGGFQCEPAQPLPTELEDFVQSAGEHGVIVMSLGTIVNALPADITDPIASVFAKLPQKVIWRHVGERPSTLGNNTLLVNWMPQKDLLGHPQTRAFVAHGGTNGVQEAIYHGTPVLGIPLFFDQYDNLLRLQEKGAARILELVNINEQSFQQALNQVLTQTSYRENMQRLSDLHRDQPIKPIDSALFWLEFVMRHRGASHLRTTSYRLPWYSYHSLDVFLFLLAAGGGVLLCTGLLVRKAVESANDISLKAELPLATKRRTPAIHHHLEFIPITHIQSFAEPSATIWSFEPDSDVYPWNKMRNSEETSPATRPRRSTRPPLRLDDYEVSYASQGWHSRPPVETAHGQEAEWRPTPGEDTTRVPLTPTHDSNLTRRMTWDAAPDEWDRPRDEAYNHLHFSRRRDEPETQLAHHRRHEREPYGTSTEQTSPYTMHSDPRPYPAYQSELEEIHMENLRLRQSQRAMDAGLEELRRTKEEMRQLVERVHSPYQLSQPTASPPISQTFKSPPPLKSGLRPPSNPPPPPPEVGRENEDQGEEEWPEPPTPWPTVNQMGHPLTVRESGPNLLGRRLMETQVMGAAPPVRPHPLLTYSRDIPHPSSAEYRPYHQSGGRPMECFPPEPVAPPYRPIHTNNQPEVQLAPSHRGSSGRPRMEHQPRYGITAVAEQTYRGPRPTIPNFSHRDPGEFARLKMALVNLLPADGTELFKYQILVDHLKLEEARLIADSYLNSPVPYSDTMAALTERFGQPHQIALRRISTVMDSPDIRRGDVAAFDRFALQVRSLVGMLQTLGPEGDMELRCGSHVARLLGKLPPDQRADFRRSMFHRPGAVHTLMDLAKWLQHESWCQDYDGQNLQKESKDYAGPKKQAWQPKRATTILHGAKDSSESNVTESPGRSPTKKMEKYCPFCDNAEHYLSQCSAIKKLSKDQHLQVLHEVNVRAPKENIKEESCLTSTTAEVLYLDRPPACNRILLKVVQVTLHHGDRSLNTYALLDDGSERSMLLPAAARRLGLKGTPEKLALRTIRQDVQTLQGASVSFLISPASGSSGTFAINGAFTGERLGLADHSYPVDSLQRKYKHLNGLPLQSFEGARPLVLIGADQPHLITPIEPVRLGPPGGPAAVRTRLGWTLQGPVKVAKHNLRPQQCLHTSIISEKSELFRQVERLWQLDVLPYKSEKIVTRSRQDQEAIDLLETKTTREEVDGVLRYATPLLRKKDMPLFQTSKEPVMANLKGTERRLSKDLERTEAYRHEIQKLIQGGYVAKIKPNGLTEEGESWYVPHHMVSHNGKNRIVFNCSFQYQGLNLNESLLPGPTLGASLLGVLLRFREHAVAISGDIKGMFHQVRLLPQDRPLIRFVWRDMKREEPPEVYEWQVLPFGTTCSPCCATFALQRHVTHHSKPGDKVRFSVERCFYVDNCLQSLPTPAEAKQLVDNLRETLASGGFDLRQWASNQTSVVSHLPKEARSDSTELWLSEDKSSSPESTLGLSWHPQPDTLGYKHRPVSYHVPTMRNIYKVLASQYDPLGFILPYTTRAKMLVRHLWDKQRDWDDPLLPKELLQAWVDWEEELHDLKDITMPRAYVPDELDQSSTSREIHVFSDASEQAYGSVAYLRTETSQGKVYLSFLLARSRVAPKRLHSMPRLELCAAVTGAQLSKLLERELTMKVDKTTLWTDSTTVLTWLQSESCRFKVFVGTRVAEIQELTDLKVWRYGIQLATRRMT